MSDFFAAAGDCVLPAVFRGLNFCKKNKPCKACTAKGRSVEKPLLPQIKYSTKYVKLQDVNYIYSIPYFPQNTKLLLPTNTAAAITTLLPARKKRRIRGDSGFRAKTSVYRGCFQVPAAYTHSYQPHQS